jgi:hypothetical protein
MDMALARSAAEMLAASRALPWHGDLDVELARLEAAARLLIGMHAELAFHDSRQSWQP